MSIIVVKLTDSGDVTLRPRKLTTFRQGFDDHSIVFVRSDCGQEFTFGDPDFSQPPIVWHRKHKHFIHAINVIRKGSSIQEYDYTIYVVDADGNTYPAKKPKKEDEGGRGVIRNED